MRRGKRVPLFLGIGAALSGTLLCVNGCVKAPQFDEAAWYSETKSYDISLLYADHRDEKGAFFNPWLKMPSLYSLMFRKIISRRADFPDFPKEELESVQNDYSYLFDAENSITFVGHASFIIKLDGAVIFLDPLLSDRVGAMSKDVKIPFDFKCVPPNPITLISHNHYDHLDHQSIAALIKKDSIFIAGLGLGEYFKDLGAKEVYELDWWQSVTIGAVTYTFLPAQHWSRRLWQAHNSTLWGGFMIEGSKTIYFSGDTGYFRGFEEFGRRYSIDYALIGAGAYEPRWFMHYQHLNVDEFFHAVRELGAKTAIPMHFGIVRLGDEPYLYPPYEISSRIKDDENLSKTVKIMRVGERMEME
ncbi:MAG: MBL fold metallo-hydrolase [Helicobacteraceae bacterium]|jgi:L-ascorbate metabolism protein UlaG (beta-lactamase superfamily)|nr:MBL fold metallo-hydrolase [Helicobacteraceae bacterium]